MKEKALFNWSGGKDSALCLYKVIQAQQYDIECLLTTVNEQYQRISMHGVRVDLLEAQAKSIGLPSVKVSIPELPTMEVYETIMENVLKNLKAKGVTTSIFGDIFLEDLRQYREDKLSASNINAVFPLWKIPTHQLIREFIDLGFKTIVACVNDQYLDKSFAGRIIDEDFLNDLPRNVDPCGENGEFHTFVFDGPIFSEPVPICTGEVVYREYETNDSAQKGKNGYWYCDLLLKGSSST